MDRAKIILRMKRISENLLKAYGWMIREITSIRGPSKEAIAFSEELEAVLNKYQIDDR